MSSLFTMSKYFAIEEFLSEFLCSDNLIFLKFFEHARVGSILTHEIQVNPNNCEVYLNLLYKLADNPHVSSRFFIPLYSRQFAMTLISIGRTSKSANVSALAFEFVAMKLIENKYPKEARDSVRGQLVAICRFITSKSTQKFDCSLRCAIDLLISIIHTKNSIEQEIFIEEEEEIYEEDKEFIIEPSPISRPRPNIPPLPRKSVQIMQNCPLSPDRKGTHSGPLNPNISQTNTSFYTSKTKTAKTSKINFNTLPKEEANPDFNSVLFSKSCPVFSGLYTIEEDQEIIGSPLESNLLPSVTSSEKFRRLSDTDPTVEAARALLRAFFSNPNCTFLHSAVFDLLSEIVASTDLFAVIIVSFDFKKFAIEALSKNPMAPYIGYIHEIIRLIQGDGELIDIAFVIDDEWDTKEEFYVLQKDLHEVPEFTGILQIESPRIW
ncbi:hypothetical protein TVAG_014510 [Trichomonas vaginalis G3]|uniref:Uncharacterized protein n=1 Tax=Trichomonas vaginalis (strain ATCC PRA-98 / G3) TaxID=412133 RepID=A2GDM7_TRIV3|nr:hypothetical protein TVAGG3_0727840 [Trichomonas vaginalis G3]EAX84739.1 hypothetical protein TVAG_014510 [Trichomonas vaginalis G3]KAI5511036.1 hypothetical protein TVAGG3_0727840 [Trichomonas vaginalis G3]|eukprot:XP_001297669.1 hypothetical protein [Trichomonas vaginalis G3]